MAPDDLDVAIECADILDGKLPHWHRGRGDAEPYEVPPPDPDFERALENAKRAASGLPPLAEGEPLEAERDADDDAFLA